MVTVLATIGGIVAAALAVGVLWIAFVFAVEQASEYKISKVRDELYFDIREIEERTVGAQLSSNTRYFLDKLHARVEALEAKCSKKRSK